MSRLMIIAGFALILGAWPADASERELLEAISSGRVELGSKVALPTQSEAPPLPGSEAPASEHMLIAITSEEVKSITDKAYPLRSAKWPFNTVFVCWENATPQDLVQRHWVREAVANSWEAHSGLKFIGWTDCNDGFLGIRIAIEDTGPHVKYLGKYLAYDANGDAVVVRNGMVLNFTYENWSPVCQEMLEYCIRTIAVHEFGHAIGFAHEQNRPDTPGECNEAPQGTSGDNIALTPWDPHSVMNYCNERYSNDGELSAFDVKAVQYIYGTP